MEKLQMNALQNSDAMLPVKAVAEHFACSAKTIERMFASGKFPNAVRIGRMIRIPAGDVAAIRNGSAAKAQ